MKSDIQNEVSKIRRFLKKLKIPFIEKNGIILVVWEITGKKFITSLTITGGYLFIYAVIIFRKNLKNTDLKELYELLLRASHTIPEVSFDLDKDGNIGTSQEIHLKALNFESFKSELKAIPTAITYFLESVGPECGLEVPGFAERE